jgi:hypothetical protein
MSKTRNYLGIMSIIICSLAFLAWPYRVMPTEIVTPLCADFGDVEVGTTDKLILEVTNIENEGIEIQYRFLFMNNLLKCNEFEASGGSGLLGPGETAEITLKWSPSDVGTIHENEIYFRISGYNEKGQVVALLIPVKGNAISNQAEIEMPEGKTLVDAFDDWVTSNHIVGKGPGKSADNRLNAFRNMLVEAEALVEQERNAEAYGQLMAAKKKIGEFITDSNSVNIAAESSTSATDTLERLMDQVLENLLQ